MNHQRTESDKSALPLQLIVPGLVLISLVDLGALLGIWPTTLPWQQGLSLTLLVLPWATLAVSRSPIYSLGFIQRGGLRAFGWGMVAGGFWRIISVLINLWGIHLGGGTSNRIAMILGAVIWVPLLEETFFRGYLGRALIRGLGFWPGVFIQALLFCLHPVHLSQGIIAMIGVFGFGVIAGWIQHRFDSLWAAWGAHAFANLLPLLVIFMAV